MASLLLIELKKNVTNNTLSNFFTNINEYLKDQNFEIINSSGHIIYFNKTNIPPTKLKTFVTFIKGTKGYHTTIQKIYIGNNLYFT